MPPIQQRKNSLRLPNYDYSLPGAYFITICTQNRLYLFGHISNGEMVLNEAGCMIKQWLFELEHKFPTVKIGEFIIMPNHMHVVVFLGGHIGPPEQHIGIRHTGLTHQNIEKNNTVGGNLCYNKPGADLRVGPNGTNNPNPSIPKIIQWFKTMTTNHYIRQVKNNNWPPFNHKLWQRNYWDRVVRNERALQAINRYIQNNPLKWHLDHLWTQI